MRPELVTVAILALVVRTVSGTTEDRDPMVAEESSGTKYLIPSYHQNQHQHRSRISSASSTLDPSIYELLRQQASANSAEITDAPLGVASINYFNSNALKPLSFADSSAESSGEVYRKAASEYWQNEMGGGDSQGGGDTGSEEFYGQSMPSMPSGYGGQHETGNNQDNNMYLSPHQGYMKGKEIAITPNHKPITLHYRTHAQPIVVHQTRLPGPKPEVKHTTSHEEPHRVVHEVIRPIIQEVHEVIQPYRRVVQQVQPVIEEVRTVIATKDKHGASGGGGGQGQGGGHGYMGGGHGGGSGYGNPKGAYSSPPVMRHRGPPQAAPAGPRQPPPTTIKYQHQQAQQQHPRPTYRKAAVYESEEREMSRHGDSMPLASGTKLTRSQVFINKKGIPVYQSNYMGPVYMSS